MKPYMPVELSHQVLELTHTGAHAESSWLKYVPLYTAGLATISVGLAATEFILELNRSHHDMQAQIVPSVDGHLGLA